MSKQSEGLYATDRATKNNDAIVTMFPYQLADEIYIGGTHPQAFSIDVDYDNLTVLYSLAGGTTGHDCSSIFAADPGDGVDNYFMYACDNIYYCGAGHGKITGMTKDNQNERYLYMNIICNSVRKSAFAPTIDVYDFDSTEDNLKNNVVKEDTGNGYVYTIDDNTEYPNFSFKASVDEGATIDKVEIFYDLDYDGTTLSYDNSYTEGDVLIASWGKSGLKNTEFKADVLSFVDGTDTVKLQSYADPTDSTGKSLLTYLKLEDKYFAPYSGKYTYIVIRVTDSNGNVSGQRIKIKYKEKLYNLT
jgi:hypothetical protein